jgi:phosphonate transport system substrate-binding protein
MHTMRVWFVAILVISSLVPGAVAQANEASRPAYRFGFASSQNPAIVIDSMGPLIAILADELGARVDFVQKASFSEMQRAFISQEIDFGIINAYSFLRIMPFDAVVPVAARVIDGSKEYQTFFFARADSEIHSIEDLQRRTVALGDPYSTSSFLIPHFWFRRQGIDPDSDFLETMIITKQDSLILAVLNRTADAGASASFIYRDQPQEIISRLRVFQVSDPFPLGPFVVNRNLDADIIERIQDVLLSLSDSPRGRAALDAAGIEGFDTVDIDDYEPLMSIVGAMSERVP